MDRRRRRRQRVFTVVDNYTFCFVFLFCVFVIFLPHFFSFLLYAYFYELIILMNARLAGRRSRSRNVPQ